MNTTSLPRSASRRSNKSAVVVAVLALCLGVGGPAAGQRNDDRNDRQGRGDQREDRAGRDDRGGPGARPGNRGHERRYDRGYDRQPPPPAPGWRANGSAREHQQWRETNRWRDDGRGAGPEHRFYRGARLTPYYRQNQYIVDDWRGHRLYAPPRGQHWVQVGADYVLVAIATGVIVQLLLGD